MQTISRREAVRGATFALALAPIPAAALAALPAKPAKNDAKLLALIASVPALLDEYDAASLISHAAWEKTWDEIGEAPHQYQDIQREFAARGVTLTQAQACRIRDERWDRASAKTGHAAARACATALDRQLSALLVRIYATRARTLEGVTAKQRLAIMLDERLDDTYEPETWAASVQCDLERLAARA